MDDEIVGILEAAARPLSGKEIGERLREKGLEKSNRTVRRYLFELVRAGRASAEGGARARVYSAGRDGGIPPAGTDDELYPLLSTAGQRALAVVRKPRNQRAPVGYNPDLLLSYAPGESSYLAASDLEKLRAWGETPDLAEAAGTFARELAARLLIDLSWASSRLEGNTYSLLDTARLIEDGQHAQGKDAEETQMILNHKRAIELLVDNAATIDFNRYTVLSLHAALSENLLADPNNEGRLRTREVGIGGSTYLPMAIPQQIDEYFNEILATLRRIPDPFEQSFFAMVHLPYLQPFVDVNKRTSRLVANIPFIRGNLVPLSFLDVSRDAYIHALLAIYENNEVALLRDIYMAAYERSSQKYRVVREAVGEPDPFRQKYRTHIHQVVQEIVRNREHVTLNDLTERYALIGLPRDDVPRFAALVLSQLKGMREENAGRYGITPAEFRAWHGL